MGTVTPALQQSPDRLSGASEGTEVEVVSQRYSAAGDFKLYSSDGVKFYVSHEHLAESTLLELAHQSDEIHLQESFAHEQALHLLLDFQSVAFALPPTPDVVPRATLDRLLPCLKLAHRYDFAVQAEIIQAIDALLRRDQGGSQLDVFVTASELDSPDLAEAAVRAMETVPDAARLFSPLRWGVATFAAVPKAYHWAFLGCFVRLPSSPGAGDAFAIDSTLFHPALFQFNEHVDADQERRNVPEGSTAA